MERGRLRRVADGVVVGRIFKGHAAPVGSPWMWTLAFGYHEDRTPTHDYAEAREAAMIAFAKSWRDLCGGGAHGPDMFQKRNSLYFDLACCELFA